MSRVHNFAENQRVGTTSFVIMIIFFYVIL